MDYQLMASVAPNGTQDLRVPSLAEHVEKTQAMMKLPPGLGCMQVMLLLQANKEPGPATGAFGTRLTQIGILDAGIGEAAANGVLRSLDQEAKNSNETFSASFVPPPIAA